MDQIHNVIHVSLLRKYISDLTYMLRIKNRELKDNLDYKKHLVHILDKQVKQLRKRNLLSQGFLEESSHWRGHLRSGEEYKAEVPITIRVNFKVEILLKREEMQHS